MQRRLALIFSFLLIACGHEREHRRYLLDTRPCAAKWTERDIPIFIVLMPGFEEWTEPLTYAVRAWNLAAKKRVFSFAGIPKQSVKWGGAIVPVIEDVHNAISHTKVFLSLDECRIVHAEVVMGHKPDYFMQASALHELGHVLGLPDDLDGVMGPYGPEPPLVDRAVDEPTAIRLRELLR